MASLLGFIVQGWNSMTIGFRNTNWLGFAVIIGILFITMFYILGMSSQKAGVTKTTISAKLSVIIPIVFSLLIDPEDNLNIIKTIGIIIAIISITLTIYKRKADRNEKRAILLPVVLFIGMGIVDSLVKFSQSKLIQPGSISFFTAILFLISGVAGLIICIISRKPIKSLLSKENFIWGFFLGIVNFGSIFLLLKALNSDMESSIIFGINNMGIVLLCTLAGVFFFKEKTTILNKIGIILSFAAIFILSYA